MGTSGELELSSGHRLSLRELRQYRTYEGWLEGLPTVEWNQQHLEKLVKSQRDKPYPGDPLLIQPTEAPIEYRQGQRYPFGTPSALPAVTCIGRYESLSPARDHAGDYSGLVVIWFQEEFAFPIDPIVISQLLAIDWERHATDLYY